MVLADGQHLPTDMLIVVTGVRPNNELAASAGIKLAANGHVVVDDHWPLALRTFMRLVT